jgi:hypothetical protein
MEVMHAQENIEKDKAPTSWITVRRRPFAILPGLQNPMAPDINILASPAVLPLPSQLSPQIQVGEVESSLAALTFVGENSNGRSLEATEIPENVEDANALVRVQSSLPGTSSQTNSHSPRYQPDAWWTWVKKNSAAQGPSPPPGLTSIECWTFDDSQPSQLRTIPLMNYWILDWAKFRTPHRNSRAPKAGLRLIHRCVPHHQRPFPEDTLIGLNKLLFIPPVYEHRMSDQTGFLARVSGADGGIGW